MGVIEQEKEITTEIIEEDKYNINFVLYYKMLNEALDEKYIHFIAKNRNVPINEVDKIIDKCIKHLSANYNIDYNNIYNVVFSEEGLTYIIETLKIMPVVHEEKNCNKLSMEECMNSNSCFYLEPYGCLSKKYPDAELINDNPDAYIAKYLGKTEDLKKAVTIASYLYYNYDGGGLSDNAFDAMEFKLKQREKIKGRAFEKIGAPIVEKNRVPLKYPMVSLDKAYPGTKKLIGFLSDVRKKKCNWSLKLDGVSGMIIYEKGQIVMINTKGTDGITGGDVTYLKDYITMPKKVNFDYLVVRGEFILSKDKWEKKYKDEYSNARAFVAGKINGNSVVSALHSIEFIAYEIMVMEKDKMVPSTSQSLKILEDNNFTIVDNDNFKTTPTMFELMEFYKKKRLEARYYIDGLVLKVDEPQIAVPKAPSNYNPTYAIAFKMQLEEQQRWTKAINVVYNISRYGKYIPVVICEAVYIDGNRLTRVPGRHAKYIEEWNMGKGTEVLIIRAGDVIPIIKDVKKNDNIIPIFPNTEKDGGYAWHWDNSDIILDEIETNKEVKIKRIVHFFETIEVPRLKQKTVEKMYEYGYETPESIVKASVKDMTKVKGIGIKTAEQFYDTIRTSMRTINPSRFIEATTSFKSGIGRSLLQQLFKYIPDIMDYNEAQIRNAFKNKKIPGFGVKRIDNVAENLPLLRAYLDSFAAEDIKLSIKNYKDKLKKLKEEGYNPLIDSKIFVLTQMSFTTDYELEDYINDNNGQFEKKVTSKTEAVICGSMGTISEKMLAAQKLGVKVLFLQEFSEMYGLNLKRFTKKEEL